MDQAPEFELRFEEHPTHLFAHVTGERDTLEISMAYWLAIARVCERLGTRRLLVLEELQEHAAVADMRQVVEALAAMGFHDIRVAYVDPHEHFGLLDLADFHVRRAGLTGRVFSSLERARGWLLADLTEGRQWGEGTR